MKYEQPYGISDPNAPYINGNPATGQMGSIPPAASIEYPQREIVNAITYGGFSPNDGDLTQLTKAMQSQKVNYALDSGPQNAMVVALNPPLPAATAYQRGFPVRVQVLNSNINDATHTTLTLDAGGGPAPVIMPDGSMPATGTLPGGGLVQFVFDGTRWQLTGGIFGGGTGGTTLVKIPYAVDTSPTPNIIVASFTPPIVTPTIGDLILVKVANWVTGTTTIQVNSIPSKAVTRSLSTFDPLQLGDIAGGMDALMKWDGTQWTLLNPGGGLISPYTAPFFPEILTGNGSMGFLAGPGSVQIQSAAWQWRGLIYFNTAMFTTPQLTFVPVASKTYHLRWEAPGSFRAGSRTTNPHGLFVMYDLADTNYNPSSVVEYDWGFDTTYDSMLVARIVTNAANVPTVTSLMNKVILEARSVRTTWVASTSGSPGGDLLTFNWARKPRGIFYNFYGSEIYNDAGEAASSFGMNAAPNNYAGSTLSQRNRYYAYILAYAQTDTYYLQVPYDVNITA